MNTFRYFQQFEWKRFFSKRNLIVFGIVLILALLFTQQNVRYYKTIERQKERFREIELKKAEQMLNYRVYGLYGFRMITSPDPSSILSLASAPFLQLTSKIDTSEQLQVYKLMQTNDALWTKYRWFMDFSSIMLLCGTFLALLYGFETFLYTRYLKQLSSIAGRKGVFFSMATARAMMLTLFFLVSLASCYALIALNGITIPLSWILPLLLFTIVLASLCFFALGVLLGRNRVKWSAILMGLGVWFISIFIIPSVVELIAFGNNGELASVYGNELNKSKIFSDYQRMLNNKYGALKMGDKPTKERKADWDSFLKNEYMEIQAYDNEMLEQIRGNATLYQCLSAFFPTSHYISIKYETSSGGYYTLIDFFQVVIKLKRDFFKKYIDVMENNPNAKVDPFLTGDANVIKSKPTIPGQFPLGTLMTILYFSVLLWQGYLKYRKSLICLPPKEDTLFDGDEINLDYHETARFIDYEGLLSKQLYSLLSNEGREFTKKGYNYPVILDGEDLVTNTKKLDFLYLCRKDYFPPDVKAGSFLSLLMGLAKTPKDEKERLTTEYGIAGIAGIPVFKLDTKGFENLINAVIHIRDFRIYFIDDVTKGWPGDRVEQFKDKMNVLRDINKALVLFLTGESLYTELNSGGKNGKRKYYFQTTL